MTVNPMISLGMLLTTGTDGVPPNPVRSVELYEKAF